MNKGELIAALGSITSERQSPLKDYIRTNWSLDPFSYGSYSHLAKGSGNTDRVILAKPLQDRVYFAGEALNPNYQSSVHAAHESGLKTAEDILARSHRRIAVIGAGICGLSAAQHLAKEGLEVTVFEARDSIGGRIRTDRSFGAALDVGASWIHGPIDNPITTLADKAGIDRVPTDDETVVRGKNGNRLWSIFAPGWVQDAANELSIAATVDEINVKETQTQFEEYGVGYEGQDVIFPCGYDEILGVLTGGYDIQLSKVVTQISLSDAGVAVHVASNSYEGFDAVIVTVPLGVLKQGTIAFVPSLPEEKVAAISRMGMGTLDKLYLLFEETFWDRKATVILTPHNNLPRGHFNHWINFEKYLGAPILMAFNYGPYARTLSGDTDEEFLTKALQTLRMAYMV